MNSISSFGSTKSDQSLEDSGPKSPHEIGSTGFMADATYTREREIFLVERMMEQRCMARFMETLWLRPLSNEPDNPLIIGVDC